MKKQINDLKPALIFLVSFILLVTMGMPVWADNLRNLDTSSPMVIPKIVDSTDTQKNKTTDIYITHEENKQENQLVDGQQKLLNTLKQESFQVDSLEKSTDIPQEIEEDTIVLQQEAFPSFVEENIVVTAPIGNDLIETLQKQSAQKRKNRLFQQDRFNYQQKDVEELLLGGYSLEDIYLSDQLGNEWLVNPKELIQQKRTQKESWTSIEGTLRAKVEKELTPLQDKHKLKAGKFSQATANLAERLELLQQMEADSKATADEVVEAYRANGQKGMQKLKQQHERGDRSE